MPTTIACMLCATCFRIAFELLFLVVALTESWFVVIFSVAHMSDATVEVSAVLTVTVRNDEK